MKKKTIAFLVFLLGILLLAVPAAAEAGFPDAADEPALRLRVELFDAGDAYATVLELPGYPDAPYYLFLPAGCDRGRLKVAFPGARMTVNGEALTSGEYTDVFREDGVYPVETDEGSFSLNVLSSENLPSVYISTESGGLAAIHADKATKEPGTLTVAQDGAVTLREAALTYVKGRGNTSWQANEKRSYNIKFKEKTGLLGMKEAKKWVLTSNNTDPTLLRNAVIYTAAQHTRIPFTTDFRLVDLYVNGNYRGNYLLCEKIEVGKNRIDVPDLDDANEAANPDTDPAKAERMQTENGKSRISWFSLPNDPADITGGYLLEYEYPEQFDTEPSAFITKRGQCLILHSPEYATEKEMEYVSDLYGEFEDALYSKNGKNAKGKRYSDYIDMDSFTDGLLLHEFAQNHDLGHTSWYLYLPQGEERFYMGPLWDFDSALDNVNAELSWNSEYDVNDPPSFITLLFGHKDFRARIADRFTALAPYLEDELNAEVLALFDETEASAKMTALRWGTTEAAVERDRLRDFIPARTAFLRDAFAAKPEKNGTPLLVCCAALAVCAVAAAAVLAVRKSKRKK